MPRPRDDWYEFLATDAELNVWYARQCASPEAARRKQQNTKHAMTNRGVHLQTSRVGTLLRVRVLRRDNG